MSDLIQAIGVLLSGAPASRVDAPAFRPDSAWLLVCLMRQLVRQRWLVRIVEERLTTKRDAADDEDEDEDSGDVPGLAGWSYEFHGRGCCLSSEDEILDVDFHGDEGATIDPYFFATRIFSLKAPGLPEARLAALLPGRDLVVSGIRELQAQGLLRHPPSEHVFRLPPALEALADAAGTLDFDAPDARERSFLWLGDFEALDSSVFAERVLAVREARREWLLARATVPSLAGDALAALQGLVSPDAFVVTCERVLSGPISSAMGAAIERLDALPGNASCPAVFSLLQRMSPEEHHPYSLHAAAAYLLRRQFERERVLAAVLAFARVDKVKGYGGNPYAGEFALLALEYAPEHALELVRRALRSSVPMARMRVSTVLCALDAPWSQRELSAALQSSTSSDRGDAKYLQLALARSQSEWARAVAARWGRQQPPPATSEFGFTHEEVMEANADGWFEHELAKARDWVQRRRIQTPNELE
ncbi:hypothetical protein HUW62_02145 [Myxococcus sp. AM011]|uniref:DUF6896 domain-containing protein n=1 Tax=Myxococcus sp. AM011 TaxID=2745200 RepID=UPI001595F828|nr:hypothetical protein [Myxococcus sp. AM011]NVJ20040.1 hypothetical protein [Myxococcus sp. AM011]